MGWTYSPDQESPKDRLRFIIGDTDKDRTLMQDEELIAVLTRQDDDITQSAIEIAEHLEAKFVRRAESRSGDIIADFLTVAGKYRDLANRLRKRKSRGYQTISTADRATAKEDTTFPTPSISLGEFNFPGVD